MQPHHTRLKVGCRSAVASAPQKWWAREDLHLQGSQILDLWGLLFPLNHSPGNWRSQPESHRQPQPSEGCALIIELQEQKMEPPAGAAPARLAYKESLQAAAERQRNGGPPVVLLHVLRSERPRHNAARKWSQFSMVAHSIAGSFEQWFLGVRVYCFAA